MDQTYAWWFDLETQQVAQGLGSPNAARLGPYDTEEAARGVLERMRRRNETFDAADEQ